MGREVDWWFAAFVLGIIAVFVGTFVILDTLAEIIVDPPRDKPTAMFKLSIILVNLFAIYMVWHTVFSDPYPCACRERG